MNNAAPPKGQYSRPLVAFGLAFAMLLSAAFMVYLGWRLLNTIPVPSRTTISNSLVVDQVKSVAKLVSSESVMRDVIVYENTWYGSTKRSLVVVTAKVLAGINLEKGTDVRIDEPGRKILIRLAKAEILALDIVKYETYDESRGLWNPFEPADRDKIFQQARDKFRENAVNSGALEKASESAKKLMETMLSKDGYVAIVEFS